MSSTKQCKFSHVKRYEIWGLQFFCYFIPKLNYFIVKCLFHADLPFYPITSEMPDRVTNLVPSESCADVVDLIQSVDWINLKYPTETWSLCFDPQFLVSPAAMFPFWGAHPDSVSSLRLSASFIFDLTLVNSGCGSGKNYVFESDIRSIRFPDRLVKLCSISGGGEGLCGHALQLLASPVLSARKVGIQFNSFCLRTPFDRQFDDVWIMRD